MKAYVNLIPMAALAIVMMGCAEDAALDEPLRVNFKLSAENSQIIDELPPETQLMISMETPQGDPVYPLQHVGFTRTDKGFTTAALDVQPGEYVITEFALVNAEGEMIYTIPYENSPLVQAVTSPLNIGVTVASGSNRSIDAQAIDVSQHAPGEFGLASFRLSNSFQVMVSEAGDKKPVPATATVLKDGVVLATLNLPAKKSRISFKGDPNETYMLVVSREACAPLVTEFTLSEFSSTYRDRPLKLALQPAFTMVGNAWAEDDIPFYFYLGGTGMNVTVDWGDGSVETYSINDPTGVELAHNYAESRQYPITITGDIDKIEHFYSFYGGSEFSRIDFRHLTNLRELLYGLTSCPSTLDLSHNKKLEQAMLSGLRDLQTLILPESHSLIFLEVEGENGLDSDDMNAIIHNIYTNTSSKNLHNGILGLRASWAQDEGDMTMIGTPSAEAQIQLESLKNDYGWIIHPSAGDGRVATDGRISARRRI